MRIQSAWLLAFAFAVLPPPGTAAASGPYAGREIRGQVLDEESGAALEGVVIVARWERLEFRPSLHGTSGRNEGNALHIAEVVTGADGRFAIPGWGPKASAGGRLDDHANPKLSLFKSGHMPLEVRNRTSVQPLKLRKFAGTPKDYGEAIQRFQGRLWWHHQSDQWKSMPQMILALHREKRRLGEQGRAILGANMLHGRSGRGELRDAQTGETVRNAVIQVTWTLRREGGTATRRFVEQRRSGVEGDSAQFYVSPWRLPGPSAPGWEVAYDTAPLVRVYAQGYRKTADRRWDERGDAIQLEKLPETKEAILAELRAWRSDAEAALAAADREEALAGQQHLLRHLSDQCRTLTADVQAGICLASDSEVESYVERVRRSARFAMETPDGAREVRIVAVPGSIQAAPPGQYGVGRATGATVPVRIAPVSGFSIEPAK